MQSEEVPSVRQREHAWFLISVVRGSPLRFCVLPTFLQDVMRKVVLYGFIDSPVVGFNVFHERLRYEISRYSVRLDVSLPQAAFVLWSVSAWQPEYQYPVVSSMQFARSREAPA